MIVASYPGPQRAPACLEARLRDSVPVLHVGEVKRHMPIASLPFARTSHADDILGVSEQRSAGVQLVKLLDRAVEHVDVVL